MNDITTRMRYWCDQVRTRPVALAHAIPMVQEAIDEIDRQRARVAELEQDAARYRWLREQMKPATKRKPRLYIAVNDPVNWIERWALGLDDADAAIDAAMKGTP